MPGGVTKENLSKYKEVNIPNFEKVKKLKEDMEKYFNLMKERRITMKRLFSILAMVGIMAMSSLSFTLCNPCFAADAQLEQFEKSWNNKIDNRNYKGALQEALKFHEAYPDMDDTYGFVAASYQYLFNRVEAYKWCEKCFKERGTEPQNCYFIRSIHGKLKRHPAVKKYLAKAQALKEEAGAAAERNPNEVSFVGLSWTDSLKMARKKIEAKFRMGKAYENRYFQHYDDFILTDPQFVEAAGKLLNFRSVIKQETGYEFYTYQKDELAKAYVTMNIYTFLDKTNPLITHGTLCWSTKTGKLLFYLLRPVDSNIQKVIDVFNKKYGTPKIINADDGYNTLYKWSRTKKDAVIIGEFKSDKDHYFTIMFINYENLREMNEEFSRFISEVKEVRTGKGTGMF